jgi:Autophagy protein Apg9.
LSLILLLLTIKPLRWTFREFNELPHAFERRLEPSYQDAEDYLKLFIPSSWLNSLGRVLVFLSGSLGAVCVAFAAVNDAILLHVKILNWNLLWYVGILGVAYSVGKGMLPDNSVIPKYHYNLFAEMDAALIKVSSHTHYYPEFWRKRGWDDVVKSAFSELFQYKLKLFLLEVTSIIVAPIILCHSLPLCAPKICAFVQKVKVEVPGAGDHCGFATFDFDLFPDESWEGNDEVLTAMNMSSGAVSANNNNADRATGFATLNATQRPKAKMGKIEKSFFNFKTIHPEWKCAASGQNLVDRVDNYQSEQALAIARERQHHIAAAARQLATLRDIEVQNDKVLTTDINLDPNQIDEQYVQIDHNGKNDTNNSIEPNETNPDDKRHHGIETFEEEVKGDKNYPRVRFQDSTLTSRQSLSRTFSKSNNVSTLASVLRYDDAGLSAELNGLLNRSTLDPSVSLLFPGNFHQSISRLGGQLPSHREEQGDDDDTREQILQRQVSSLVPMSISLTYVSYVLANICCFVYQYLWLEKYHSSQHH